MLDYLFSFQLFGEGGDGGDGGSSAAGGEAAARNTGEDVPAHIPERAKKMWKKAFPNGTPEPQKETTQPSKAEDNGDLSYSDLIKSEKYKADHQAYMEKAIGDRLKKYKGIEEQSEKMKDILSIVSSKYGLDANSETFVDDLKKKVDSDEEYYEQYAIEHDLTTEEAKNVMQMQRRLSVLEAEKAQAEKEKVMQAEIIRLRQNAERTKSIYPGFDLDKEMQDERFRNLCAATHGDTTAAYQAIHAQDIIRLNAQAAVQKAAANQAQTVASNKARPVENGNSSNASSVVDVDFSRMNLKQIREYAEQQRRKR